MWHSTDIIDDHIWSNRRVPFSQWKTHKENVIYLCLDGLSLDRHHYFFRKLLTIPLIFAESFEQALEFQKALTRVIELSRPLRMSFRTLQSVRIAHDSLLHVRKEYFEWKKLQPLKASDNHRLSSSLEFLVHEEINRLLLNKHFHSLSNECLSEPLNVNDGVDTRR